MVISNHFYTKITSLIDITVVLSILFAIGIIDVTGICVTGICVTGIDGICIGVSGISY